MNHPIAFAVLAVVAHLILFIDRPSFGALLARVVPLWILVGAVGGVCYLILGPS